MQEGVTIRPFVELNLSGDILKMSIRYIYYIAVFIEGDTLLANQQEKLVLKYRNRVEVQHFQESGSYSLLYLLCGHTLPQERRLKSQ